MVGPGWVSTELWCMWQSFTGWQAVRQLYMWQFQGDVCQLHIWQFQRDKLCVSVYVTVQNGKLCVRCMSMCDNFRVMCVSCIYMYDSVKVTSCVSFVYVIVSGWQAIRYVNCICDSSGWQAMCQVTGVCLYVTTSGWQSVCDRQVCMWQSFRVTSCVNCLYAHVCYNFRVTRHRWQLLSQVFVYVTEFQGDGLCVNCVCLTTASGWQVTCTGTCIYYLFGWQENDRRLPEGQLFVWGCRD